MDFVAFKVPAGWGADFPTLAPTINNQARAAGIAPCLLAAVIRRETGGRNVLEAGKAPGPGAGVGYAQITYAVNWSDPSRPSYTVDGKTYDLWDPSSNLYVAAYDFLAPAVQAAQVLLAHVGCPWAPDYGVEYYTFAMYNAGIDPVQEAAERGEDPDGIDTQLYASGTLLFYRQAVAASNA